MGKNMCRVFKKNLTATLYLSSGTANNINIITSTLMQQKKTVGNRYYHACVQCVMKNNRQFNGEVNVANNIVEEIQQTDLDFLAVRGIVITGY